MNGAAMNCRQDPVHRTPHQDSSSLHNPGYHLQINRQPNLQPQNSKTLNYPSFSNNYQVDGFYGDLHHYDNMFDSRHSVREVIDPRFQRPRARSRPEPRAIRSRPEPIDLPVPQFEIDEHSVSHLWKSSGDLVQDSKGLDLDTRIGLLIKSKALAVMHPIFSDLNESEESESDLDDPFVSRPRSRRGSNSIPSPPRGSMTPIRESFDDPEKPLSRPPSPFLSRATYLFWFNKAIEIKQQAKAQEQALLEQAAKRLIQDNAPLLKSSQPSPKKPILKNLMDEISKELKEVIKQEFIRDVIEATAFNSLDDWWEKQNQEENSDKLKNEPEPIKLVNNTTSEKQDSVTGNSECQGSTSPKMPFPWKKDMELKVEFKKKESLEHPGTLFQKLSKNKASKENLLQNLGDAHLVHQDKDVMKNKASDLENLGDAHLIHQDKDTISSSSLIQNEQESQPEELNGENIQKNCEVNCQEVGCSVKHISHKIDNHSCKLPSTYESEILVERKEFLPLSADNVDSKFDEKNFIVKSILDLILNNVSKTIMQRNDETLNKDENKKPEFHNCSKLTVSMDNFVN